MPLKLKDKVCLITKCGGMQGPAIATEFQREGAILYLQSEDLSESRQILSKFGVDLDNVNLIEADFTQRGVADTVITRMVEQSGRIDVLVNNNWHEHLDKTLLGIDEDGWEIMMRALLTELFYVSKAAIKHMVPARDGKILNCTAAAAIVPYIGKPAYSAARSGSIGFTKALGKELAPYNIQVNAIAQNWVENPTYFPDEWIAKPENQELIRKRVPLGRLAKPWEQAKLAVFLASDDSDFICGEVIRFTGGSE